MIGNYISTIAIVVFIYSIAELILIFAEEMVTEIPMKVYLMDMRKDVTEGLLVSLSASVVLLFIKYGT